MPNFPLCRHIATSMDNGNLCGLSNIISFSNNSTKPRPEVAHQDARFELEKQNVCSQIGTGPKAIETKSKKRNPASQKTSRKNTSRSRGQKDKPESNTEPKLIQ